MHFHVMAGDKSVANGAKTKSDEATKQWQTLIRNSLRLRLDQDKFLRFVEELSGRTPIPGHKLAALVVESQRASTKIVDPRIPLFIAQLHDARIINSYDVLAALFSEYIGASEAHIRAATTQTYELAANVLDHLTRCFLNAKSPKTIPETRNTLAVLSRWLEAVASTGTDSDALLQSLDQNAILLYDYLGSLAIAMLENVRVGGVIEKAITTGK